MAAFVFSQQSVSLESCFLFNKWIAHFLRPYLHLVILPPVRIVSVLTCFALSAVFIGAAWKLVLQSLRSTFFHLSFLLNTQDFCHFHLLLFPHLMWLPKVVSLDDYDKFTFVAHQVVVDKSFGFIHYKMHFGRMSVWQKSCSFHLLLLSWPHIQNVLTFACHLQINKTIL